MTDLRLAQLLSQRSAQDVSVLLGFWDGTVPATAPVHDKLRHLHDRMTDADVVSVRLEALGAEQRDLLDQCLRSPSYLRSAGDLAAGTSRPGGAGKPADAVVEGLRELEQLGFLFEIRPPGARAPLPPCFAVPRELGDAIVALRRRSAPAVAETITLRGFLDRYLAQRARPEGGHARETYKLYADEGAILARLRRLPADLQEVVTKAATEFGGIVPRSLYERLAITSAPWDADAWRAALERSLLGTVAELALTRFGVQTNEPAIVVFHEVVVAKLKECSASAPPSVATEVEMGVDLVSDLARFLTFLGEDHVRFTVHGELFKTSERRLVEHFVPGLDPRGKEPSRREVLDFIYRFAMARKLVDRTGERTFSISARGREWERRPLIEKQQSLLEFILEDTDLPGEPFHQVGMRFQCLKYLKRLEPERWVHAMDLPFLARNAYLATLDRGRAEEYFARRMQHASTAPLEDLQQMCWSLLAWIRRRLALLGVVDLGLDSVGRPAAIRLSRLGAKLLGVLGAETLRFGQSHLVVNPDFEVVLLPEGDEFDMVHALDRFCERRKHEVLYHYELTEESVRRGLHDGLALSEIVDWLTSRSRSGLPQNVLYSLREWGAHAGVVVFDGSTLSSRSADVIERLWGDSRVRPSLADRTSPTTLALKPGVGREAIGSVIRDLGLFLDRSFDAAGAGGAERP